MEGYLEHDNNIHLNSAVGYITTMDMLAGWQEVGDGAKAVAIRRQQAA